MILYAVPLVSVSRQISGSSVGRMIAVLVNCRRLSLFPLIWISSSRKETVPSSAIKRKKLGAVSVEAFARRTTSPG